ncbi:C39 family peptidase [Lacticaseibacillus mingshuiensis]|uniref:C39 family peptidase n=1 Tax=Lacticaseibacillus mingshuiensis TaxID=2799574 RepID=UPI001CEC97F7|nr:C39 family peptidase [Lacticaseibacillus mingshuiensis]
MVRSKRSMVALSVACVLSLVGVVLPVPVQAAQTVLAAQTGTAQGSQSRNPALSAGPLPSNSDGAAEQKNVQQPETTKDESTQVETGNGASTPSDTTTKPSTDETNATKQPISTAQDQSTQKLATHTSKSAQSSEASNGQTASDASTSQPAASSVTPDQPNITEPAADAPMYEPATGYATIISAGVKIWSDLTFSVSQSAGTYLNQTLKIDQVGTISNGSQYYRLRNAAGQVIGYINALTVAVTDAPQGRAEMRTDYLTVIDDTPLYRNFDSVVLNAAGKYYHQTLRSRGLYHHFNGRTYASLYDNANQSVGYAPLSSLQAGSGVWGAGLAVDQYATISSRNFTLYQNFDWVKKSTRAANYQKTFQIKYLHHGFNGSTFASLYNNNGRFVGIVNLTALRVGDGQQGAPIAMTAKKVVISSKSASLWRNFSWVKKGAASTYYGQTLLAKCLYQHFNGSSYYSLYTVDGVWVGYLNASCVKDPVLLYKRLDVVNYSQYANGIPEGCEGVSLMEALKYKRHALNYSPRQFLSLIPKASSPYAGFVGSPFVSSGQYTAIFAAPLAKWGRQFGDVADISGSSVNELLAEVEKGNPVVAYVTIHFATPTWAQWPFGRVPNNNHAVVLAGFNKTAGTVYVSDPIDGKYWLPLTTFSRIYNARKMAVVVR